MLESKDAALNKGQHVFDTGYELQFHTWCHGTVQEAKLFTILFKQIIES